MECLGFELGGHSMVGTDETTELWWLAATQLGGQLLNNWKVATYILIQSAF